MNSTQRADYISMHVPKLKETTGLLNKAAFDKMKDGVMIMNCARGGIVNEDDLQAGHEIDGKVGRCRPGCVRDRTSR